MGIDYDTEIESFEWDIPESYAVTSVVGSHAEEFGDRLANRFLDEGGTEAERTYADIRDDMNRVANGLSDLVVEPGDQVIHLLPWHPDVFAIQLGALATTKA